MKQFEEALGIPSSDYEYIKFRKDQNELEITINEFYDIIDF